MLRKLVHNLPYIRKLRKLIIKQQLNIEKMQILGNSHYRYSLMNKDYSRLPTSEKLQFLELKFGGYVTALRQTDRIQTKYPKIPESLTGGDRFNIFYHDYSKIYAKYISLTSNPIRNLLEIGILNGIGLAVWDSYFPDAQLYGFDWDLGNFEKNYEYLLEQGAFKKRKPNLYQYDQFKDNSNWLKENFSKISFDIIIDDAYHSDETIINSFGELIPCFSEEFVYIIEDNKTAWKKLETKYPKYKFDNYGEITVVTSR